LRCIGLRIDVDTAQGAAIGLPRLLALLDRHQAKATLCIPGGADRSALALGRVFTQKGYIEKLWRTRAFLLYAPSVAFSLLPIGAPSVLHCAPAIADAVASGHELAVHGHNHTGWHNRFHSMAPQEVRAEMAAAFDAVQRGCGTRPSGFAAPGWQAGFTSLAVTDELGFEWGSDTRGTCPFLPRVHGYTFATPQVPTTLPTLDELPRGLPPSDDDLQALCTAARSQPYPLYTAHAELEGRFFGKFLERFLDSCKEAGLVPVTVSQLLASARASGPLPVCELVQGPVPGRPGIVAMQGTAL